MSSKKQDGAAFVDEDGKLSNSELHEQMTRGVNDHDLRMKTKKDLIDAGVPQEVMDRLIQ